MNSFAVRTSLANTVGYCVAVGFPTIIDSSLHSQVNYGARTYPAGYLIFLPAIAVFVLTYFICTAHHSCLRAPLQRTSAVVCVLLFVAYSTFYNFRPELPHAYVLICPLWFAIIIGAGTWLNTYKIDLGFLDRDDIESDIKSDRLKIEYDFWWKIFMAASSAYAIALVYIWICFSETISVTVPNPAERNNLLIGISVAVIINFLVFVFVFAWEAFEKLGKIKHSLL